MGTLGGFSGPLGNLFQKLLFQQQQLQEGANFLVGARRRLLIYASVPDVVSGPFGNLRFPYFVVVKGPPPLPFLLGF